MFQRDTFEKRRAGSERGMTTRQYARLVFLVGCQHRSRPTCVWHRCVEPRLRRKRLTLQFAIVGAFAILASLETHRGMVRKADQVLGSTSEKSGYRSLCRGARLRRR